MIFFKTKGRHGLLFDGVKMEVRVRGWVSIDGCIYFWQRRGDN